MRAVPPAALLILASLSASADPRMPSSPYRLEPLAPALVCARSLVEKISDGVGSVQRAARVLGEIEAGQKDYGRLESILRSCYAELDSLPAGGASREQQRKAIAAVSGVSRRVKILLADFVRPMAECTKVGLSGAAAMAVVGLSAAVEVAKCRGTNGRKWIEASVGVGTAGGGGGTLMADVGDFERHENYRRFNPFKGRRDQQDSMGFYAAWGHSEAVCEGMMFPMVSYMKTQGEDVCHEGRPKAEGIGIGAGAVTAERHLLTMKIIPLGTDEEYLVSRFDSFRD